MRYHWQDPQSLIKDVDIFAPHQRSEALIHAPEGADPEALQHFAERLRARGYLAQADTQGESAVLRVMNIPSGAVFLGELRNLGGVVGEPAISKNALDDKPKKGLTSLQIGGAMQVAADGAVMATALSRGKEGLGDFKASLTWAWAFLIVALFGAKNPDKQVGYIYRDIADQSQKTGVELSPEGTNALNVLAEKNTILRRSERFVREHPIQINAAAQAVGGWNTFNAGSEQLDYNNKPNWYKRASGSLTMFGNIYGGLLAKPKYVPKLQPLEAVGPDGKPAEATEPPLEGGPIDRLMERIERRPLTVTGFFSIASNAARILSGLVESKKYKEYMGDEKNNYAGGIYAQRRQQLLDTVGNKLDTGGATLKQEFKNLEDGVATFRAEKQKGFWERWTKAEEKHHDPLAQLRQDRDDLKTAFNRVSRVKQAAFIDFAANAVKMVANFMIASSPSKIDADLAKTGQLDELCAFFAREAYAKPEAERANAIANFADMLAAQQGVDVSEEELAKRITGKVVALVNNPWQRKNPPPRGNELVAEVLQKPAHADAADAANSNTPKNKVQAAQTEERLVAPELAASVA